MPPIAQDEISPSLAGSFLIWTQVDNTIDFVSGSIETLGKTKLTIYLASRHLVYYVISILKLTSRENIRVKWIWPCESFISLENNKNNWDKIYCKNWRDKNAYHTHWLLLQEAKKCSIFIKFFIIKVFWICSVYIMVGETLNCFLRTTYDLRVVTGYVIYDHYS
jgi:hypothetical protein